MIDQLPISAYSQQLPMNTESRFIATLRGNSRNRRKSLRKIIKQHAGIKLRKSGSWVYRAI